MNNIERRDAGLPYIADDEVLEQQKRARRLTQELNTADRSDFDKIGAIVKELLGKSDGAFINPPFYCDYGFNIEVGKNFFANYNCTILDVGKLPSAIIASWLRMWQSIRQVIRYIRIPETVPMSTAFRFLSEITAGSEATV